jgi:squalene-hopene/tetraprenyl-beta-curcumene cyclase
MLQSLVANLLARQEVDGRFDNGTLSTYVTAAVVTALATLPQNERIALAVHNGAQALRELQWNETDQVEPTLDWYGGAGYGKHGRPDLSSTQWLLEGLHAAGDCSDARDHIGCDCDNDPARQRAIAFLTRCQNAKTNDASWAGTDGGFVYTAAGGGESMASQAAGEGRYGETMPEGQARSLRSYGSMTYAGYKSLLFAGLSPSDPRVQAALDWIRSHWTMEANPGMGRQGWFFYLHGLARAMAAGEHTTITDAAGVDHDWRAELVDTLVQAQRADGAWVNEEPRWLEGKPELATIYAVLALQETLKAAPLP